jgi:hypothetical protein
MCHEVLIFLAESTLPHFLIECGKKEILQDGLVVGAVPVSIMKGIEGSRAKITVGSNPFSFRNQQNIRRVMNRIRLIESLPSPSLVRRQ